MTAHSVRAAVKQRVVRVLDDLRDKQAAEVLDFALFLKQRTRPRHAVPSKVMVRPVPVEHLDALTGLVAWGGDALKDAGR